MPSEIPASRPNPPVPPSSRPVVSEVQSSLRVLDNLPQQLAAGQQLEAQVLAVKEAAQLFHVLLKMQLPSGQQATVNAQSPQLIQAGQLVTLTAMSANQFNVSLSQQALGALNSFEPEDFPTGTLIQAKVLNVQAQPQGHFRITLALAGAAQAGQQFSVDSSKALNINSILTARVEGRFELALIPSQSGMQRLAVDHELGGQFSRQASSGQFIQQLLQLSPSNSISSEGQKTIQQLLGSLPDIGQKLSTEQLAELLKNSGSLLESRLLGDAQNAAQHDVKANLLRLIAQLAPAQLGSNPLAASSQGAMATQGLPQLLRELGGINSLREQAMRFPVNSRILDKLDNPNDLGALLRLAAAAVSRLQTHQLASLGQTYTTAEGTQVTTWQTEIPMRDQNDVVPVQIKLQQEEHAAQSEQEKQPPIWRLELSFELEPLGPLHAQVNLQDNELSSRLWAERKATVTLVTQELHHLRDKLLAAGLNIKELECLQGIPPAAPKAAIERRWIDDLA